MPRYLARILWSFVSLVLLLVMVFFLSRLTGDPAALFLPIDATPEMVQQFRELHGLNDPVIVQFGRYLWDVLHLDFGESLRKADEEVEGRLSRALVQLGNSRDALRDQLGGARRAADRLLREADPEDRPEDRPALVPVVAVGRLD